ncbi:hypothetical protein D3C87_2120360 [compost metagenome]
MAAFLAVSMRGRKRSRLSAIEQLIFFWLKLSDAEAKIATSSARAVMAISKPFRLGVRTE